MKCLMRVPQAWTVALVLSSCVAPAPQPALTGAYHGVIDFWRGQTWTGPRGGGLRATFTRSGRQITGVFLTSEESGSVEGTISDLDFRGRVTFQHRECDMQGKLVNEGLTFTGRLACATGETGSFALSRR
jgi:hypothetical protein